MNAQKRIETVVLKLETALAAAKRGELQAVAIAATGPGRQMIAVASESGADTKLLGLLSMLVTNVSWNIGGRMIARRRAKAECPTQTSQAAEKKLADYFREQLEKAKAE